MDLKAVVVSGEAPESDDDVSNIATVCYCSWFHVTYSKLNAIKKRI